MSPYSYFWSIGQTVQNLTNLGIGTYQVTATDLNGCQVIEAVTLIEDTNPMSVTISSNNVTCFGGNNGSVTTQVTGGTVPYTYSWTNGGIGSGTSSLSAGLHSVTVTDSNSLTATASVYISQPSQITPSVVINTNYNGFSTSCYTCNDGQATVSATGGNPPYTYNWSTGETTQVVSNLLGGTYFVTITDNNQCEVTEIVTLTKPNPIQLDISVSSDYNGYAISCNGATDGGANATVMGGVPPFTYQWSTGTLYQMVNGLSVGTYIVTATDANGVPAVDNIYINEPSQVFVTETITDVSSSGGSDGSIILDVVGGTLAYGFNWSNGEITQDVSGLMAGTYYVTITDANMCTVIQSYQIQEIVGPTATADILNITCFGYSDGEISLTLTGGVLPYQYVWSSGQTDAVILGLTVGTYTVTVTDFNNDSFIDTYVITEPTELSFDLVSTDATCYGGSDGQVELTISGGTTPYIYLWSNSATGLVNSGLIADTYMVFVTDDNNCSSVGGVAVEQPDEFIATVSIINASDIGIADGEASISVSGNTAPYTYLWSTGSTSSFVTGLVSGNYYVLVMDANMCDQWVNIEIQNDQGTIYGCTNPTASNYNPMATVDDGSCFFIPNTPEWNYSLTSSNHTILIPDTIDMLINGIQIEAGDYLGVFYDSVGTLACAGYVEWNETTTTISVWATEAGMNNGFASGELFTWKIFDESADDEYIAESAYFSTFANDSTFSTNGMSGLASLDVVTIEIQTVNLVSDWSIFSTYIYPTNPNIADVLSNVVSDVIIVKDSYGQSFWPFYTVNLIGNLTVGQGYQINMSVNRTLEVEGLAVTPELEPISLAQSWFIIGYLRKTPAPIITMLSSIESNIEIVKDYMGMVYWPLYGVNLIINMNPGQGYQINMNAPDILVYPANSLNFPISNSKSVKLPIYDLKNTGNNMTLGIPLQSWSTVPAIGDQIGVYSESGIMYGASEFSGDNMAISLWGNDEFSEEIDGLLQNEKFVLYQIDYVTGNKTKLNVDFWQIGDEFFETNDINVVGKISESSEPSVSIFVNNMPNPFKEYTLITFTLPQDERINIVVYNVLGERVDELANGYYQAGKYEVKFNANDLPAGLYFYKLNAGNKTETHIMNLVR